jgi:hypothetical protein
MRQINCVGCGCLFTPKKPGGKYHSRECHAQSQEGRPVSSEARANMSLAAAARHRDAQTEIICERCGNTAIRAKGAHYCSTSCNAMAVAAGNYVSSYGRDRHA